MGKIIMYGSFKGGVGKSDDYGLFAFIEEKSGNLQKS